MTTVPTAQSRTAGELIRDPMFGPYVTGNIMSSCGNWVQQIAAAVLMFQLTRSAFMVGARRQQREGGQPRVLGGVRYLRRDRTAATMVGVALMGFGADPVITLTPSLADRLGGGSGLVGLFASVFGAGAVLMVLVFQRLRDRLSLRQVGIAGYLVAGVGLVVAALTPFTAGTAVGFFVNGAGFLVATVALSTRIQRRVPDELRGRVMALWGSLSSAPGPSRHQSTAPLRMPRR